MGDSERPVVIGRIGAAYGVQGWFRVQAFTDPMENFLDYRHCRIGREGEWREVVFDGGRRHGKGLVAHIAGVDTPEAARELVGSEIAVPAAAMPELAPGEYYWHQLEGLQVLTTSGECLGRVDHLFATGANDVMVVKPCAGSIDTRERLLPWLPEQVVLDIRQGEGPGEGEIRVDWDPAF